MNSAELCFTSAIELSRLVRARQISPVEITEAVLTRVELLNPTLNAFLTVTADLAREEARAAEDRAIQGKFLSPLDGIPYSMKDLEPSAGIRTTYGSKWFEQHVPPEDGIVAARLRASGGILLGKTNTPNLGHKDMCDNLLGPPCRNPWKLDRTSGGSSGGAAAAVATGLGPLAHGTDGGGSIRIPSALCGVFGLKPSFGRVPYHPNADYWAARSHNGPIARTVRDAALLLQLIAGPDSRDPLAIDAPPEDYVRGCDGDLKGIKVAWSSDLGYAAVDTEVRQITERAARRFLDLGCIVEEPVIRWPDSREFFMIIGQVAVGARNLEHAMARPDWCEPSMMRMVVRAGQLSALEYGRAVLARSVYYDTVRRFFETYDLLLTPQMPLAAWSVDPENEPTEFGGRSGLTMFDRMAFTYPFNLTGQPAASVPCGFTSDGRPVAIQIVGRWHADSLVLRAAASFEALQPWGQHRPPLD